MNKLIIIQMKPTDKIKVALITAFTLALVVFITLLSTNNL